MGSKANVNLLIIQRQCILVINGNYIRIAAYVKLNLLKGWHLIVKSHVPN